MSLLKIDCLEIMPVYLRMDIIKLTLSSLVLVQVHAFTALYHLQIAQNVEAITELYRILNVNYAATFSIAVPNVLKMSV